MAKKRKASGQLVRQLETLVQRRKQGSNLTAPQLAEAKRLLATLEKRGFDAEVRMELAAALGLADKPHPRRLLSPPSTMSAWQPLRHLEGWLDGFDPMVAALNDWMGVTLQSNAAVLEARLRDLSRTVRLCHELARRTAPPQGSPLLFLLDKHHAGLVKLARELPRNASLVLDVLRDTWPSLRSVLKDMSANLVLLRLELAGDIYRATAASDAQPRGAWLADLAAQGQRAGRHIGAGESCETVSH